MPKSPRLKRFIRKIPKFLGEDYTKERKDTLKLLEMEKIIQETTRKEQKNGFLPKSPHRY